MNISRKQLRICISEETRAILPIALIQGFLGCIILGTAYVLTNENHNGDLGGFFLLVSSYFLCVILIIWHMKSKIKKFYLRKGEIFYIDEFTGLPNISAFTRDIDHFKAQSNIAYIKMMLVEITNQNEISAAFGRPIIYKMQAELARYANEIFHAEIKVYQVQLNTLAIFFPPNCAIDLPGINERPQQIITVENIPIFFDVVCGGCEFPGDGNTAEDLLRKGYLALQEAHRRRMIYFEYNPTLEIPQKIVLLGQLSKAMKNHEMVFYYQPIIDTQGNVTNIEALVRWNNPQMGLLPPSDFISDLELTGIANFLLDYSLDYNLNNLQLLLMKDYDLQMAINVSITNLQQINFAQQVLAALKKYYLQPTNLVLEITERGFLADDEESNKNISELSRKGVSFHIDDFGVGFTSLGNLRKYGIRSIKIDQSFISDLQEDQVNRALVNSVIAMAKAIGISTVAEGVEATEMLEILRDMGIDYFQGYAIAKPMPFEELCVWLQSRKRMEKKE